MGSPRFRCAIRHGAPIGRDPFDPQAGTVTLNPSGAYSAVRCSTSLRSSIPLGRTKGGT